MTLTGVSLLPARPKASGAAASAFGPPPAASETRTRAGSKAPVDFGGRIRRASSSVIRTRGIVRRSPSGAMNDVTIATMTMIENICGVRIPSDSPIVATTIPIAPRAFIATAIEAASQNRMPPQ